MDGLLRLSADPTPAQPLRATAPAALQLPLRPGEVLHRGCPPSFRGRALALGPAGGWWRHGVHGGRWSGSPLSWCPLTLGAECQCGPLLVTGQATGAHFSLGDSPLPTLVPEKRPLSSTPTQQLRHLNSPSQDSPSISFLPVLY